MSQDSADSPAQKHGPEVSRQLSGMPVISSPRSSWRRDSESGSVVYTAPAVSTDALMGLSPTAGSVDWLQYSTCLSYSAPSAEQEAAVEMAFRRCRYDNRCAVEVLRDSLSNFSGKKSLSSTVDAHEDLLSWWCRRCWEDRRTKEAADAVKRAADAKDGIIEDFNRLLARGFVLSSWCRFSTTARRASQAASSITGGSPNLFREWQRCRGARGEPARASSVAATYLRQDGTEVSDVIAAVESCCADSRCLARALERANAGPDLTREVWQNAATLSKATSPATRAGK